MTVVHSEAIAARVQFGSVDLSAEFVEAMVSDDHLGESGLVTTTGSLKLAEVGAAAQSLDDWDGSPLLQIGTTVTLDVDYGFGWVRHPRGHLIVQGSKFTEETDSEGRSAYSNEIEVGCLLAARNFEDDVRSELELPSTGTIHSHVELLAQLAGLGPVVWGPGTAANFAFNQTPKLDGTYVETLGKMLASIGCFAWCDGLGNTRVDTLSETPIWSLDKAELSDWERVLIGKPPRAIARASGSYNRSKLPPTGGPVVAPRRPIYGNIGLLVPDASGWGVISEVISSEFVDEANWRVIKTRQELRLGFNVFKGRQGTTRATPVPALTQTIISQYEPPELGGKLLSITETNQQPLAAALQGYADWAIANSKPIQLTTDIGTSKITTYAYHPNQKTKEISSVETEAIGAVLSSLSPDWKIVYERWGQPSQTQTSRFETQQWIEKRPGQWEREITRRFPAARGGDGNNGMQQRIDNATSDTAIADIYSQAASCSEVEVEPAESGSGHTEPPEAERWPGNELGESVGIHEEVVFAGFASNWAPQRKNYTCPYLPDIRVGEDEGTVRAWLRRYAEFWHNISIREWRSLRVEMPLSSARQDYRPYAAVDFTDSVRGREYRVALNGTTWKLTPTEATLSSDTSLIGRQVLVGGEVRTVPLHPVVPEAEFVLLFDFALEVDPPELPEPVELEGVLLFDFALEPEEQVEVGFEGVLLFDFAIADYVLSPDPATPFGTAGLTALTLDTNVNAFPVPTSSGVTLFEQVFTGSGGDIWILGGGAIFWGHADPTVINWFGGDNTTRPQLALRFDYSGNTDTAAWFGMVGRVAVYRYQGLKYGQTLPTIWEVAVYPNGWVQILLIEDPAPWGDDLFRSGRSFPNGAYLGLSTALSTSSSLVLVPGEFNYSPYLIQSGSVV